MSRHQDSGKSDTANLGKCREVRIDGFDGDSRAVLVLSLIKPLRIDGVLRNFAGLVLEEKQIEELARGLMTIAKRQSLKVSLSMPGPRLVRPVRFVR